MQIKAENEQAFHSLITDYADWRYKDPPQDDSNTVKQHTGKEIKIEPCTAYNLTFEPNSVTFMVIQPCFEKRIPIFFKTDIDMRSG